MLPENIETVSRLWSHLKVLRSRKEGLRTGRLTLSLDGTRQDYIDGEKLRPLVLKYVEEESGEIVKKLLDLGVTFNNDQYDL